jgi:hypothetical protein
VREATREGRLPHLPLGRYRHYSRAAIKAWLNEQQAGPPSPPELDLLPPPRKLVNAA